MRSPASGFALAPLILLVAGCALPTPTESVRPAGPPPFNRAGLESVLGHGAGSLQAAFGRPDLDVREGRARKLQFASPVCVLDVYLYPPARGGEGVVTYLDARLPDGRDMDRASCVAALTRRQQAR